MGPQLAFASPKSLFGIEQAAHQATVGLMAWAYSMRPFAMRYVTAAFKWRFLAKVRAQFSHPAPVATGHSASFTSQATLQKPVERSHNSPLQLTLADQWTKISSVLVRSVEGASAIKDMQSAATQQLDLAQYGLSTLIDELAAVMAMPGVTSSRRISSASVHAFGGSVGSAEAVFSANRTRALAA